MKTCASCGKSKSDSQFSQDGRTKDNLSAMCVDCRFNEAEEPLRTVDIPGIEILASGGPVKAIGSPPEGDFYTRDELVAIADAHHELGDEIRAPIKLGHSARQQLAASSGLTSGEMPALGWLDNTSFRVEDDESGIAKLVADAKAVPGKVADLMRAGAYRTRSSELRRYSSQATQKTYDWVVEGLALMGEKIPAIQTLDDVYRLYERAGIDKPDEDTAFVIRKHAAGDVVWNPEDGFQDLMSDLMQALNPGPGQNTYWVSDISVDRTRAIVCDYDGDQSWIVPFTLDDQGEPTPAPSSDWIAAEQAWVSAANDLARKNLRAAESRASMADEQTISLDDLAPLAEKLGVDGDITIEALSTAAEARANELAEAKKTADAAERKLEADDTGEKLRKLEADLEAEKTRSFEQRRDADIKEALRTRELEPAAVEKWEKRYNELGEDIARELLFELPERETVREFGRDDDGSETTAEQRLNENAVLNEIFPGADLKVEA